MLSLGCYTTNLSEYLTQLKIHILISKIVIGIGFAIWRGYKYLELGIWFSTKIVFGIVFWSDFYPITWYLGNYLFAI